MIDEAESESICGACASIDELRDFLQGQYGRSMRIHPDEVREVVTELKTAGLIKNANPWGSMVKYVPLRERVKSSFEELLHTIVTELLTSDTSVRVRA